MVRGGNVEDRNRWFRKESSSPQVVVCSRVAEDIDERLL